MSAEKIRTALGLISDDPDDAAAWSEVDDVVTTKDGAVVLRELERARVKHERYQNWSAVAKLLDYEINLADDDKVAIAKQLEQARIYSDELLLPDNAEAAFERVLALDSDNAKARDAMQELQAARDKWEENVEHCLIEALDGDDPATRARFLVGAADTTYRYGDHNSETLDTILDYLRQALELRKTSRRAKSLQALVYSEREDWERLADVLTDRVSGAPTKNDRIAAAFRLAQISLRRLDDEKRAIEAYQLLLDLQPTNSEALAYLVDYYSNNEEWDHLVALYEDQIHSGAVKQTEEFGVWVQLAMLHWKTRDRPNDAEPYFEKVRRVQPTHQGMLHFFRERCTERGDSARLTTILTDAQRALEDGEGKRAILEEIAALAEGQENARRAIDQYKTILRSDPTNGEAREKLKGLYLQTESYNALVELYRQDLQRFEKDDRTSRLEVLREIAAIYRDRMKSDTALLTTLTQMLQLAPDDMDAVRQLTKVYESLGRWRDLLNMQQRLAELTDSKAERISLLRAVARRWVDQFSNVQNAINAYEALLEATGDDVEAREKLSELYKKRRAWPKLYELLEQQVEMLEGEARNKMMIQMAQLAAERLNKGAEAITLLKKVLHSGAKDVGVLDQLEKQAERTKDYVTVAEVLERRFEMAEDEKSQLSLLQKLGSLYSDKLDDTDAANGAWRRVLEVSPGHKRALRVLRQSFVSSGDWDGLEELYGSQDDFDGLADFLSTTADRTKDDEAKIELSFRAAGVYSDRLGAPERAVRSYERVLSIDEGNVRSAQALLPLYEDEEKWSRLPGLYSIMLSATDDIDEKIDILHKIADVTGGPLANKTAALAHARKAYELRPDDDGLERLQAWSEQSGEWQAFIEVVQGRLDGEDELEPKRVRELRLKLAKVYANEVEKLDDAVERYRELVEDDPSDAEAVAELEELLRAADRRDDLRWLFELKADRFEGNEKSAALEDWATVEEEVFGEPERAIELLQRVVQADPHRGSALNALTRLLLAHEEYEKAAETMATHREAVSGDERLEMETRLAEIYYEHLERPGDAYEACVRALEIAHDHEPAVELLEQLLDLEQTRPQAADTLERIYAQSGQHDKQVGALQAMLEAEEAAERRLELCERLADVQEHELHDSGAAFEVVLGTLLEAPDSLTLWDRAQALGAAAGRPTDLAEAYRRHLTGDERSELEQEVELELCDRAAILHEDALGDGEGAVPYLERMLELDSANERAFERLKQILTSAERWESLEKLYLTKIDASEELPALQVDLLNHVALVAEEMMGSDEHAIAYYERALKLDPIQESAGRSLERLYAREERFESLAELLEKRLETASDDDANEIQLQLVDLYLHRLEQPAKVMGHLEMALRLSDDNAEARGYAEECLEVPELRQASAQMLDEVYEGRDDVRDLVRILGVRLQDAENDDQRRELLQRIAQLRDERLKDDEGAFDTLCQLVSLEPDDVTIRERLVDIGRRLGEHKKMAEALLDTAERCTLAGTRGEILMSAAELFRDQLEDNERAEQVYRQVVAIDADDPILVIPATKALALIYEEMSEHAQLADVLNAQVPLVSDPEESSALYERIANLYEDVLENNQKAIDAWKARLADDMGDEKALRALERLYANTSQWSELVDVLHHLEQSATDSDERRRCMVRAAEVLSDQLEQTNDAINAWRAVLDDFGPETETLSALSKLYPKAERWDDHAEVLDVWLSLTDELDQRVDLYAALGDVRREHLSDAHGALASYREVLMLEPSHDGAREALEKMLEAEDPDIRREAAETIGPLYEADGDAERLLKVIDIEIESTFDPVTKLDKLRTALRTAEDTVNSPAQAFGYAARGVREAIGEPNLSEWIDTAERLGAETEKWPELLDLYEEIVGEVLNAEVQQQTRLRAGELARTMLEDEQRAIRHYRAALEAEADDRRAMIALEELYEATEDAPALKDILQLRCEAAEDDAERVQLLHRIAELQAGPLEQRDDAIETYEQLIDLELDDDAVKALEALYTAGERWEQLCRLFERQLEVDSGERGADIRVNLARVNAQHLSDGMRALEELSEALNLEPSHEAAIAMLEGLLGDVEEPEQRGQVAELLEPVYLRRADWERLEAVLKARLDTTQDPEERGELLRRLAALYEEQLEDYAAALETVAQRLREDPSDEDIWNEIERLGRVLGSEQEERVANIFAEALSDVADDPKTAALSQRTGELYAAVGAHDKALKWYRRAHEFSLDSEELFEAIDGLLIKLERHSERVDHYRAALDRVYDDEKRVAFLHTVAELQHAHLDQDDEAIDTYGQLLDIATTNEQALDALTELYKEHERNDDLAELYERRAALHEDPERSAPFLLALARLLASAEETRLQALDHLERIVEALPWHVEAVAELEALLEDAELKERVIELLRQIYQRGENWRGLIKLNDEQFALIEEAVERGRILCDTARLWEDLGEDYGKAFEATQQAFKLMPDDPDVRANLERLAEVLDAWDRLADTYDEIVAGSDDEFVCRPLLDALALISDERLDDPRRSLRALSGLSALDPADPDPLERMDTLCMLLGDWPTLVVVLQRKADNEVDPEEKASLLRRLGEIKGDMLDDADGAVTNFEQALELEPTSLTTLDRLIDLYDSRDGDRLAELIQQRVEHTPEEEEEERHALLLRAALVQEERLDNRPDAIAMLQQALEARPTDAEVLASLERLYRAEELWGDLLDNLRTQADTTADGERRLGLRNKIGDLCLSEFEDAIGALEQYRLVLEEERDNAKALAAVRKLGDEREELRLDVSALLEPVLIELGRYKELIEVMELRLSAQQDPSERAQTLTGIAMTLEEQLDDPVGAQAALLRAIPEVPEDAELHEDIARLCELAGEWLGYAEVLDKQAGEAYAAAQVDLFTRLGRVCEERLDDAALAIDAFTKAVEVTDQPAELFVALDRLYVATANSEALAKVLERRIDLAESDAQRAELYYRLASLQIEKFDDKTTGLATLKTVVDIDPEHAGAREQLEGLTSDEELFDEVAEALDVVYRVAQDSAARAELQNTRIGYTSDPQERVNQRIQLAQMLEEESFDTPSAQRVIEQALVDAPISEELLEQVERLAATNAAGDDGPVAWRNAAAALSTAVETGLEGSGDAGTTLNATEAHDTYLKVAGWLKDRGDDAEAAEQALKNALGQKDQSTAALMGLEEIHRQAGRERDLVATLRRIAELAQAGDGDVERSPSQLRREAKVLAETALEDFELTEGIVREMLSVDDADLWALTELCGLVERNEDYKELYNLLVRRIELTEGEPEALRHLRHQAAHVAADKLDDREAAIDLYEQAFEEDGNDTVASSALRELYEKLERYEDMLRFLERLVDMSESPAERAQLRYESSKICLDILEAPTEGIEHLRAVLEDEPAHQEAVSLLSQELEKDGRDDELAELLKTQTVVARERGDRDAELGFKVKVAELYETRLNDSERAIEGYVGVLETDPDFRPALVALARLHEGQDQTAEAAEMYEKLLVAAEDDEAPRLALKARDLYVAVEDPGAASRVLEAVLERGESIGDDNIVELRDGLRSLYRSRGAWDELAALITHEASESETDDERVVLYRKAAEVHAKERADHAAAAELLEKALELKSDDRDLMLELCDEYTGSGRGKAAIEMLERVVESYGGRRSKELADIHHRIASAYLADGDLAAALGELESARKMDPGSVLILLELGRLSLRMADADDGDRAEHLKRAGNNFRSLLLQRLDKDSPLSKSQVFYHLAEVNEREGDKKKAIQMLERALANDKNFEQAKAYLDELKG